MKLSHTTKTTTEKELTHEWHVIDAADQTLGRMTTKVASLLIGKTKPTFVPHLDCGDFVVVLNAEKVKVTGKKFEDKTYYHHSMYPGGFKAESFKALQQRRPEEVVVHAVKGMLPKNKLRAKMLKRLRVVAGSENPYQDKMK